MAEITIKFFRCIQDSQVVGSSREHMKSSIYFTIDNNPEQYICIVNQPDGGNYAFEQDPIVVITPDKLRHKVNIGEFREAVEDYYRQIIGRNGNGIRISGNVQNIVMSNNIFNNFKEVKISESGFENAW